MGKVDAMTNPTETRLRLYAEMLFRQSQCQDGKASPAVQQRLAALKHEIDRATAIGNGPVELDDLKIIVLMVFWSLGEEPDALILDELFVDPQDRLIH